MKRDFGQFLDKSLFESLISDGIRGDKQSFEMRARRLISQIKKVDEQFASKLYSKLNANSILRSAHVSENQIAPVDSDTRQKLLIEQYPVSLEANPIWPIEIESSLLRAINERAKIEELLSQGLLPTRSLLLEGPPGTGKTLTAKWLAKELDLPLLTLDLATVMSSFLGKTGNNIRAVIKYAQSFPCVLLLDEFDSIAKKRDDETDVGELKRLVTVLLQSIDEWPVSSLLVAATNHGELLDRAIWRRFDKVIDFDLPAQALIEEFLKRKGLEHYVAEWIASETEDLSLAQIEKLLNQAKKNSILESVPLIDSVTSIFDIDQENLNRLSRDEKVLLLHKKGLSQRKISEELEISRPTVSKILRSKK